jgi:signal transduction histidine kinase
VDQTRHSANPGSLSGNHPTPPPRRSGWFARLSLEQKLPLFTGALLFAATAAVSTAAYLQMRATAQRVSSERLASVTTQLADLLRQSGSQIRARMAPMATDSTLAAYVKAPSRDPQLSGRARSALLYTGANPEQVLTTELRDSAGHLLLAAGRDEPAIAAMDVRDVLPSSEPTDSAVIGAFRLLRDTVVFPTAVRVGGTRAYVIRWRRLAGTRQSREQLNRLVGSEAAIFIGNSDHTVWTDLERPVPGPPLDSAQHVPIQSYRRGQGEHLASVANIPGTRWKVVVDFPAATIMAPVRQFLGRIALIGLAALLLALAAAWLVSKRITKPLRQLTDAAASVAAGDATDLPPIPTQRADEIGVLGRAFATMAAEVRHTRENLERSVDARTRDLNDAMQQLHDAQGALVRRERLAMLGQLSSGVGHELRNPLGVMTNALYYLKAVQPDAPPKVKEYLDIIQQQVTLSEKIVGDLLDFARQKAPQRKPTPLAEATDAQIARLGRTDGVRIEQQIPRDLPAALVDPIQLGQIVLNLLTNAQQALDGNGRIVVRAHVNGGGISYEVTDSGPGIAAANREKIFEPLFTTKARGIGLGLAVSRTLARANGGDLNVESEPGQGATFRLTLQTAEWANHPTARTTPAAEARDA